jgi:hypothetical protein
MMYTVSDFVCVQHDWTIGLLRHRWNGVEHFAGLHLFQSVHESLLEMARHERASNWLIELGAAPIAVEDQLWLEHTWLPELTQTQVRQLAVVADDAYNLMVLEELLDHQEPDFHHRVQIFADAETALEWLTYPAEIVQMIQAEWECGVPSQRTA